MCKCMCVCVYNSVSSRSSSGHKADNNIDGCETNFQHDLHHASLEGYQQDRRDDLITLISPRKLHLWARSELITDTDQITLHFLSRLELVQSLHEIVLHFLTR